MTCADIDKMDLARAFKQALESKDSMMKEVDIETLSPYLEEAGASCGSCPALLELAKKAFEDLEGKLRAEEIANKPKGICGHARKHRYDANGVPDLLGSPIEGTPI